MYLIFIIIQDVLYILPDKQPSFSDVLFFYNHEIYGIFSKEKIIILNFICFHFLIKLFLLQIFYLIKRMATVVRSKENDCDFPLFKTPLRTPSKN